MVWVIFIQVTIEVIGISLTPKACFSRQVHFSPFSSADPEGGQGGLDPPGKSQGIWVYIGNKQLDPTPLEKVGPSGKCWTPSETLKNDRFL